MPAISIEVAPMIVIRASPFLAEVREFTLELLRRIRFDQALRESIVNVHVHVKTTLVKLPML